MSQYNGRRAPNVSQYIANLNTIPSAADVAGQQDFANFVDDDLAMFTNTQFFDFDMNEPVPEMPNDVAFMHEQQRQGHNVPQDANKGMGFVNRKFKPAPTPSRPSCCTFNVFLHGKLRS